VEEHRSILIVDDLQSFAEILLDAVKNKGYDAICAFDYETAINIANERNFDFALLDYSLGDGKHTGLDIAQHIRTISKRTKIILMSGEANKNTLRHIQSFIGNTIDHFIRKPLSASDIFQYI
jgi:two-component system alkaline phosphatase synthesis response regulator PhoP